ncbi:acyltransferase [Brevibacillus reuszeri]|uniref:Acyltransferase n=1 Tax=Brevibacillus reuszeri TaxID=54915 RepID=A0A0K9YRU0_9BACL|nr:acyltransferase family protein [Brevibacillus reuszeri]KNB70910.1 acyltransferase [Brevibacillus reuszeri]MED1857311.1 acyltransferase family protein [Brevibacillus reuszeri]GED66862.1 acyltransferase [Brevibacillus reuszeri]
MPEPLKGSSRYMAGIDGLRALAVLAVIVYHLNYNWAPGGLLGVGIFFVLSGYLITDLLIAQWTRHGRLDMKDFWIRRARRLLPALLLLLMLVVAWAAIFSPAQMSSVRGDVPAAILYVSNWWLIFQDVSYFQKFGPPSPLGHLWSLAVEEQFYLFWPLLLAFGLHFVKRRGPLIVLTLLAAAISALAMAFLYEPGLDPSRVYYGTDTRVFALLIGAVLAMVWPSRKLSPDISAKARITLDATGFLGLAILLYGIWKTNQYDDFLYQGGLVLLSVVSAVVVAVLAHPASHFAKWMGCKPLRWLGVRSYAIYLWHYPIIVLTTPTVEQSEWSQITRAILQLTATLVLAALSWKYIEEPIRRGALGKVWAKLRPVKQGQQSKRYTRWIASGCAIILCVTYFGVASLRSDATASQPQTDSEAMESAQSSGLAQLPEEQGKNDSQFDAGLGPHGPIVPPASKPETGKKPSAPVKTNETATTPAKTEKPTQGKSEPDQAQSTANANHPDASDGANPQDTTNSGKQDQAVRPEEAAVSSGKGITALGDSVMLDVAPHLEKLLPGIVIDAKIGRQMSQAPELVEQLKAKGLLGNRIIIELGTNGAFSKKQLEKLLQSLDGADQIILVNTRVPKPWESVVNATLAEVAAAYPHTSLIDWYAASAGKSSYFYNDGVHLKREGSEAYAALLAKSVRPEQAEQHVNPEKKPASDEAVQAVETKSDTPGGES